MKIFNDAQKKILAQLDHTKYMSGSNIAAQMAVSRTTVWKQINQLIELGVPIKTLPQKGYQLEKPLILLDAEQITKRLNELAFKTPYNLSIFATLDSTNLYLKNLSSTDTFEICCSELQTQGRGRFNRSWRSPFGENIYCSMRWQFKDDLSKLSGLSLITSLAIVKALEQLGISENIKIKWPNDIYWQDKKLCGSLIEIKAETHAACEVIIGIGLNVNSNTQYQKPQNINWTSLYEITNKYFNRNEILALLITWVQHLVKKFSEMSLAYFLKQWEQYDYLKGQHITVHQQGQRIHGQAKGINALGQLVLESSDGDELYLSSGDTTLSPEKKVHNSKCD